MIRKVLFGVYVLRRKKKGSLDGLGHTTRHADPTGLVCHWSDVRRRSSTVEVYDGTSGKDLSSPWDTFPRRLTTEGQ